MKSKIPWASQLISRFSLEQWNLDARWGGGGGEGLHKRKIRDKEKAAGLIQSSFLKVSEGHGSAVLSQKCKTNVYK